MFDKMMGRLTRLLVVSAMVVTVGACANNTPKAVVVADALWCGACKPEAQPVPMPEIY